VFEDRRAVAPLDEPDRSNAIHGLVRWLAWQPVSRTDDTVALGCVVHQQPAYPWRLDLKIEYRLSPDGLMITTVATNRSDSTAPFGIGFHPYLTVGTSLIDEASLTLPALRRLETDERGLPTGDEAVSGTDIDFTGPRAIGSTRMDTAFTTLRQASDGSTTVRLERPDGGRCVELWMERDFGYVMAYTGDTLEPVARRRQGIAIEPMTCPPNALRTGIDLIRLDPESSWTSRWGIRA
jgi:aldose 1-epimerase